MIVLKNQTIYKCEYCGHRKLSKTGVILHEREYCKNENSPAQKNILDKQANCTHEHVETAWTPIVGEEFRSEPNYDYCVDCNKEFI